MSLSFFAAFKGAKVLRRAATRGDVLRTCPGYTFSRLQRGRVLLLFHSLLKNVLHL